MARLLRRLQPTSEETQQRMQTWRRILQQPEELKTRVD
jgi:predicted patatin/cPLA2 family phospholipase